MTAALKSSSGMPPEPGKFEILAEMVTGKESSSDLSLTSELEIQNRILFIQQKQCSLCLVQWSLPG